MTSISNEYGQLVLAPEAGGSVVAFKWDGVDVLRPFDPAKGAGAPATDYAAFPLFPFSGRIANGVFAFEGKDYAVPPNFPPEPHAIHGQGWQTAWDITQQTEYSITLGYKYVGAHWPWAYEAAQIFTLLEDGLQVGLRLTNLSQKRMPAGIGWHPYFPAAGARVLADVSAVWRSGEDMIPAAPSALCRKTDLTSERRVERLSLDNAFAAGPAGSRISWADKDQSVKMTACETLRHLVVYTPEGEDFFCVEPVSHSPNAVNSEQSAGVTGLKILEPDETLTGTVLLKVDV